ncbi:hypothetical protein K8352_07125 [Flavobacteriaceae bacterium F89]|uniref:Uncharacterized protein n=1 Tax=Cerina litoralis TaxID=2874477 RepID=A0AAE3JP94_9FLAO|nr:hypothetical protein [Cerina litoralis]MCG2460514.1 hypothetical protein [Cerina litoralis]
MRPTLLSKTAMMFALLVCLLNQPSAKAQNTDVRNPILTSKFVVGLGVFSPSQVIRLGANGSTVNDEIDFGKAFDLKSRSYRPNVYLMWRFFNRWRLYGEYFSFDKSNERKLDEDLHWQDYTLKAGTYVKGGLGLDVYRALVGYALMDKTNQNLIIGIGAHTLGIRPHLEGEATINDQTVHYKNKNTNFVAPLPNIILRYTYAINDKWSLSGKIDWLAINLGDYGGGIWDVGPSVQFQAFRHFSVNLDYRYFKIYGDVNRERWNGSFFLEFKGPTLSINANF